jgi:hypothetical protein
LTPELLIPVTFHPCNFLQILMRELINKVVKYCRVQIFRDKIEMQLNGNQFLLNFIKCANISEQLADYACYII